MARVRGALKSTGPHRRCESPVVGSVAEAIYRAAQTDAIIRIVCTSNCCIPAVPIVAPALFGLAEVVVEGVDVPVALREDVH